MAATMMYPEGRFYEAQFPELEEVVVVQVKRIVDMGAYVSLLEYDGREGMMLLSELSKRRIRSVSKLLRVGRIEICMVLRVDEEKGYIDLSKRRVAPEDAVAKEESYAKSKAVHSIMRHCAATCGIEVEELCNKISWPLDKKFGNAYEALRKHAMEEVDLWSMLDFTQPGEDLTEHVEKIKEDIEINLRRKLIQQLLRFRAKVDVACSEYEGIDAIREALVKGMEASKEDCEVKIKLIAHPTFVLTCTCRDKILGSSTLEESIQLVKKSIEGNNGTFHVRLAPELVGDREEEKGEGEEDEEKSSSGSESDEEGMGELDEAALEELRRKTVDVSDEEDDNDAKDD